MVNSRTKKMVEDGEISLLPHFPTVPCKRFGASVFHVQREVAVSLPWRDVGKSNTLRIVQGLFSIVIEAVWIPAIISIEFH